MNDQHSVTKSVVFAIIAVIADEGE